MKIITVLLLTSVFAQAVLAQFNVTEVPEEVRMERPSQEELTRAAELLQKFRVGLEGNDAALLEKYPYLVDYNPPFFFNLATMPELSDRFLQPHQRNLARARQGNVDVLFMGDSITDWWRNESGPYAGKDVFDKYWSDLNIANFGIAGDTTQGVLYRLDNGEGEGFTPKAIMLMIGTNNTISNNHAEIAEGIGAIVLDMERRWPEAEILLLGVFPRSAPNNPVRDKVNRINDVIKKLGDRPRVHYMDIGHIFMDENEIIPVEIMSDGLHPSPAGYELWAQEVDGPLRDLLN